MATRVMGSNIATGTFLTAAFEPRQGGRMVSLLHAGAELTRGVQAPDLLRTRAPYPFGLMYVSIYQESYWHNELTQSEWRLAWPSPPAPGVVQVDLAWDSPTTWPGIRATKRFWISDQPWIDWEIELDPDADPGSRFQTPSFVIGAVTSGRGRVFAPASA